MVWVSTLDAERLHKVQERNIFGKLQQLPDRFAFRQREWPPFRRKISDGVRIVTERGENCRMDVRRCNGMGFGMCSETVGRTHHYAATDPTPGEHH